MYLLMTMLAVLLASSTSTPSRAAAIEGFIIARECVRMMNIDQKTLHDFLRTREDGVAERPMKCFLKCYLTAKGVMADGYFHTDHLTQKLDAVLGHEARMELEKCGANIDTTNPDQCERAYVWFICAAKISSISSFGDFNNI